MYKAKEKKCVMLWVVKVRRNDDEVAPSIEQEENNSYYINDTVGAVGDAYHFEMNGTFENTATISFEFDSDLLNDEDFDPVIMHMLNILWVVSEKKMG